MEDDFVEPHRIFKKCAKMFGYKKYLKYKTKYLKLKKKIKIKQSINQAISLPE